MAEDRAVYVPNKMAQMVILLTCIRGVTWFESRPERSLPLLVLRGFPSVPAMKFWDCIPY